MNSKDFTLVACISSYREGSLLRAAVESCRPGVDHVVVWEGPAGDQRCDDAPASPAPWDHDDLLDWFHAGVWETDAAKRDAMLQWCKKQWHHKPLWIVWVDGDEILQNAVYLRDLVQSVVWEDDYRGASLVDLENGPTGGFPLKVVDQQDGNVATDRGRLIRADLVRRVLVSNLIYELVTGVEIRLGRVDFTVRDTARAQALAAISEQWSLHPDRRAELARSGQQITDLVMLTPPLPGEPFIVHRSQLRHPARRNIRLHEQEKTELEKLGLPIGNHAEIQR